MGEIKKILICPLNWGLGHAARCVPIINELIKQGAEVVIASEGDPLAFLKQEFPMLRFVEFKGYNIKYGKKNNIVLKMFLSIPKILFGIYKEHKMLNKIIEEHKIDAVISDNRFGCWNTKVKSIYISHQIMIKSSEHLKFLEGLLYYIHKYFIKKYDECWIPDLKEGKTLSGDLSHKYTLPTPYYYIGTLSRFTTKNNVEPKEYTYDLMVILSGPEPQRTIFEDIIIEQLKDTSLNTIIVRGKPDAIKQTKIAENITIYSHLNTADFKDKLLNSEIILCRSGYSTLMDLSVFGKEAILVPTPGQTEQEYLAAYHKQLKHYYSMSQKDFNLEVALLNSEGYKGIKCSTDAVVLKERIQRMLGIN